LTIEVIASSKSLLKYIRGDRSVMFCQGWRYDLLQEELENAKQFKTSIVRQPA